MTWSTRLALSAGVAMIICLVATSLMSDFYTPQTAEYWARRAHPPFSLLTYVPRQVVPTRYPGPLALERVLFLTIVSPPSFISRRVGLSWNVYDLTAGELRSRPLIDLGSYDFSPPSVEAARFLRVAFPFWSAVAFAISEGVRRVRASA